ncbi:ribonuclease J [Granulosicoccus antarcticus]|uniref:Ribonuclease J n=1 Tax=Granulosicoccus antarcticus IMCC3135 TaxID=1192854 RepID=A0A2Z2NM77_9GAMM|nr:ribonuclease J [Granulosicoccus antarcticus]ASJ72289.1 Ribonuclease J [Granulosicoccus antarcticus IMCC3135]
MTPDASDFWFLPLGGCGEIGMNMNLYGHDDQWLMVDCGVTFRDADGSNRSGYHVQMADPGFITERREQLQALLLTHAHEDHIGAVAHLWRKLRCPIYATAFTAEMLRRKLAEHGLVNKAVITLVEPGDRMRIGAFDVEWIPNTHSIPSPCGVAIRTSAGSAFHTADWKLDPNPVIGHHYHESIYRALGDSGIQAMVCDSTCADQPGHSLSESALYDGLHHHVTNATGRVVVACFGSNIARLHTLARIAKETGRHLGLLGRSLINTAGAAKASGLWPDIPTLVESDHLGYLPRESLLLVATGSQGEPRTALHRLSHDSFRDLALQEGDTVIFSARAIPGNESSIEMLIERLQARGIIIVTPDTSELPIHASGHPGRQELEKLYSWVRPSLVIPVHGEPAHLDAQVDVAKSAGIARQLNGRNGDLFVIGPNTSIRRNAVPVGRLGVGQKALEKIA